MNTTRELTTAERIARLDTRVEETKQYLNGQVLEQQSKHPGKAPEVLWRELAEQQEWQNEMYEGRAGAPSIPFLQAVSAVSELKRAAQDDRVLSPLERTGLDFLCLAGCVK